MTHTIPTQSHAEIQINVYTYNIFVRTTAHRILYFIITHNTIFKNKSVQLFHNDDYSNSEISVNPLTLRPLLIYITVWNINIVYIYVYKYMFDALYHHHRATEVPNRFL